MSLPVLCPRAVGSFTAFLLAVALSGCNRTPPPTAATPAASSPNAAAAPAGKTEAAPAGKTDAATPGKAAATPGQPGASSPAGASNPAMAAKRASDADKDKARQSAAEMVPVETALVTRGAISAFLSYNTTLETEAVVDIYPQTGGQVEELFVEEGRVLKAGEPLLKIEDRELRVDVEESETSYEHLKKNFARTEDLYQRNLVNKQDYETQHYQLEQARLRFERAKIRLAYATVRAPFDGVISARDVQVGARVGSGTKLFSMVKLDELVARVYVPARFLPIVAENQTALVTSEFLPNRTFNGSVKRISPVIDPKSGTFKVTVGVRSEKASDLPPGLFVGVRIVTDTRPNAVLIPKRAVVYEGGERYVFTVVKDRAVKKKLIVGYEDSNNFEAVSGFEVGTPVIVLGQSGLKDGAMVRSVNALAVPAAPVVAKPEDASAPAPQKATAKAEPVKPEKS